jgi:copper chaperone
VKTATLKVDGMSCDHCVKAVTEALQSVSGVRTAEVDLGAGRAVVEYDEGATSPARLVGAVMEEGYSAEETV